MSEIHQPRIGPKSSMRSARSAVLAVNTHRHKAVALYEIDPEITVRPVVGEQILECRECERSDEVGETY